MTLPVLSIVISIVVIIFVLYYMGRIERALRDFPESLKDELHKMDSEFKKSVIDTQQTVMSVKESLGKLGEQVKALKELGENIERLEEILRPPKLRGGMGEVLLENIVREILPSENYRVQHRFRSGEIVDMALFIGDKILPVDSKFPLDAFERLISIDEEKRNRELAQFRRSVKARIDEIATKYIKPSEGTYDFALMYIPAEGVYYEAFIKKSDGDDLYGYALKRRVIPVSPQTFYAYLQVILYGLKGLKVEEEAKKIVDFLGTLEGELGKFERNMDTLGNHIKNANNKFEETLGILRALKQRVSLFRH